MRKNNWQSKTKQTGVMTIAEVHQQAAQEQAEKTKAASRESMSRGGSRAGHSRRDGGGGPGEWQSVNTNARPLQRPTDFTNIGRNISATGLPSAPTFGPQSAFKRKGNAASGTPPMSRQPSTNNMYSILSAGESAPPAADASEAERPRLKLAPRTKPVGDEDAAGEGEEGGEGEEATGEASDDAGEEEAPKASVMSETEAKAKIAIDMKELWGDKGANGSRNPEDIVHYFRALPETRRPLLVAQLIDDMFRISKLNNADVLSKGWKLAQEQEVITREALVQG
jgi:translation initiation factor 4G